MPAGLMTIEPDLMPEEEFRSREKKIREEMTVRQLDALLLYADEYRWGDSVYIGNYCGLNMIEEAPYCIFLPLEGDSVCFVGRQNLRPAQTYGRIKDVRYIGEIDSHLDDLSRGKRLRRVGYTNEDIFPQGIFNRATRGLPDATFEVAGDILRKLRLRKSDAEVRLLRKASEIGDIAFRKVRDIIRPGVNLLEIVNLAESTMRLAGGQYSFAHQVGVSEQLGQGVTVASDRQVKEGELVVIGLDPVYRFYYGDEERTWRVGAVNEEKSRLLLVADEVIKRVQEYARPGITFRDLWNYERDLFKQKGYADNWKFSEGLLGMALGHGVGLECVECPNRSPRDWDLVLESHMVLAIKAELHDFAWGGLRQESCILITENGAEWLNKVPHLLEESDLA